MWYCFKCQDIKRGLPESLVRCPDCRSIKHYKNIRIGEDVSHAPDAFNKKFEPRTFRWQGCFSRGSRRSNKSHSSAEARALARNTSSYEESDDSSPDTRAEQPQVAPVHPIKGSHGSFEGLERVCVCKYDNANSILQDAEHERKDLVVEDAHESETQSPVRIRETSIAESGDKSAGRHEHVADAKSQDRESQKDATIHIYHRRSSWFVDVEMQLQRVVEHLEV